MQGAPADVLATASTRTMQTAQQAGRIQGQPVTYAANQLQIAVRPGNPKQVTGLPSLVGPQVTESVCAPAVPCGAATEAAERAAGVTLDPVSEEQDVRSVLQRVTTGNVDAGLVYVTDVRSTDGQVQGIDFPQATAQGAAQNYLIGAVAGSPNADLADRIEARPSAWVGQAQLALASVPTLTDSGLEARRSVLRTFCVARDDSYVTMAGGLARVASSHQAVISSQTGALSKDTWVLASEPEKMTTTGPGRTTATPSSASREPKGWPRARSG